MSPLFAKLNWKGDGPVYVLGAPASFASELATLSDAVVLTSEPSNADAARMAFLLAFVTTSQRIADIATLMTHVASSDPVVWLAYPKLTSKRYSTELSRDRGWDSLHAAGFDTVRQVAIDEDWSALRFRRVAHIRSRTS